MAILNATPDSFYSASRLSDAGQVLAAAERAMAEGADILDLGACSTRPGYTPVPVEEEWRRLEPALRAIRTSLHNIPLSIDTFQPEIARRAMDSCGPLIINDISGGCEAMYALVREYNAEYIWTLRGQLNIAEQWPAMQDMRIILDPGLGFTGSTERDYECLRRLPELKQYGRPILVGLSRKSMVYRPLGLTPETCLAPTQVLHLYALQQGASILRTHDVRDTMNTITIYNTIADC